METNSGKAALNWWSLSQTPRGRRVYPQTYGSVIVDVHTDSEKFDAVLRVEGERRRQRHG
jgi:hypothetical protein